MPSQTDRLAVVLIGHGSPATDCPPQLIGELMSLEWRAGSAGHDHGAGGRVPSPNDDLVRGRAEELDATIRNWPRHDGNDPYKAGLERVAEALRPLLPTERLAIGYNEFCRPTIAEAIESVIREGAIRVLVIPSMLTPGGVHAERDIPRALDALRIVHPAVAIDYLWPFDIQQVAALLAEHVSRALPQPGRSMRSTG